MNTSIIKQTKDIIIVDKLYPRSTKDTKIIQQYAENDYRKIASEYFKKEILPDEVVHHIDGNHSNNDPENLVIMKKTQHSKIHVLFNFENWRKERTQTLCNCCLFVELYDGMNTGYEKDPPAYELLYAHADLLLHDAKHEPRIMDALYKNAKRWKEENKHDCYKHEHMEVVCHV
jgi:hypothetical protein